MRKLFPIAFCLAALAAVGCLTGCASPRGAGSEASRTDPVLVQLTSTAKAAFAERAYNRAARLYGLARDRARATDDAVEVGKQSYNLAACLLLADRPADAQAALTEAEGEFQRQHMDTGPVWLLQARAARALGQTNEAELVVSRIVESHTAVGVQAQAWLLHGRIACDAGQAEEAEKALARARHLLENDPALRAGVAELAGRIAALSNQPGEAALQFDKEATFMQRAGRYRDMADALGRGGDAWVQAGDAKAAALRHYRSARSYFGQGDAVAALRETEKAVKAAGDAGDEKLAAEIAALFAEIRHSIGKPAAAADDE